MSNLTDAINGIFGKVDDAIGHQVEIIGSIIGVAADVSGAIGAVTGAVGFIEQLINTGQPDLATIQKEIQNGFAQLGKENQAAQILERNDFERVH
jgi:hypothetical protein